MPRPAFVRGRLSQRGPKRPQGLNRADWLCVMTGVDVKGDAFFEAVTRGALDRATCRERLEDRIEAGATVVTDDHSAYKCLEGMGAKRRVRNSKVPVADINKINTLHSALKNFFAGKNGVSSRRLHLYLAEFAWRWSFVRSDERTEDTARQVISQIARTDAAGMGSELASDGYPFFEYWGTSAGEREGVRQKLAARQFCINRDMLRAGDDPDLQAECRMRQRKLDLDIEASGIGKSGVGKGVYDGKATGDRRLRPARGQEAQRLGGQEVPAVRRLLGRGLVNFRKRLTDLGDNVSELYAHMICRRGKDREGVVSKNVLLKPVLKWVGGKRQLLDEILPLIPDCSTYVEPFLGGGAVLLAKQPKKAIVNDANPELMNVYSCVRDDPDGLLDLLREHEERNCSDHYYETRALDREPGFETTPPLIRAARIIYLNKTCYNVLYRVNAAGQFNSPYGRYAHPNIVNEPAIRALSVYLNGNVRLMCGDYTAALKGLRKGSFVYFDPPYMPISSSSSFTGYTEGGFGFDEQVRLRDECDKLRERGVRFLLSNSDCPEIRELYADYEILTVKATRSINSKGQRRGAISEVLIRG